MPTAPYRIHAVRYAHRACTSSEVFYGDHHAAPMTMDDFALQRAHAARSRPVNAGVGRQRLREWFEVLTKPVDQVTAPDPSGGEIEHEALLVVYGRVDLGAVENEEGLHGGVAGAFVAVDKRVPLNQREGERGGLLDHCGIQIDATEHCPGLGDRRLDRAEIANFRRAAGHQEEAAVQVDDLPQGEIAHQARRR